MNLLVTGGTGSFGQAFVEKVLPQNKYEKIIIYSRDEQKQELMARKFNNHPSLRFFIGDVRDRERTILAMEGVTHCVHTAALKIVPAGEYNPDEFIKTNIIGTQNVIHAMSKTKQWGMGITKMLTLSTDKAVQPVNLYGASKLCAEKLTLAANNTFGQNNPKYSVVRYGNVAGSRGSVIPVFDELRKAGKDLTVTHPEMTRYWITLQEAVEFVYNRLGDMRGGETFIPKMPSFKVSELAIAMGTTFICTGVRPGEKIHETLDGETWSNQNDVWLDRDALDEQLEAMGYAV